MQVNPKTYNSFLKGVSSYENMQYQNAIKHFVQSISDQSTNKCQKQIYQSQNKVSPLTDISRNLHPICFQPLSNLSSCLIKTKQYQQASKICHYLLSINPYISLPYYNLASIEIREEKYLEAIGYIKCAISCEYLRKHQRVFGKDNLDKAIQYAHNNLQAIKYRIGHNFQYLSFIKQRVVPLKTEEINSIEKTKQQLQSDNNQYKKLTSIYQLKFYSTKNTPNDQKFFISSLKPHFVLEGSFQIHNSSHNDIEHKLNLMKQLKQLRELYLELLKINENQINLELFLEDFLYDQEEQHSYQKSFSSSVNIWKPAESSISNAESVTVQTEFELDDSSYHFPIKNITSFHTNQSTVAQNMIINSKQKSLQGNSSSLQRYSSIPHLSTPQNKENINFQQQKHQKSSFKHFKRTSLLCAKNKLNKTSKLPIHLNPTYISRFINEASEQEELKTSRNKAPKQKRKNEEVMDCLSVSHEKDHLNSSIISILDYDQPTPHLNINENYHPSTQMVESIIVRPPLKSSDKFWADPSDENKTAELFSLTKNRSHQNLFTSTLVNNVTKKLSHSRQYNQNMSLMVESKFSHHKLLSCSKCSIDHSTEENHIKNVKLNINLTEVYNYPGDYSELSTFCVVKHLNQSYRTEHSKGKFPNWKSPISLSVQNLDHIDCQTSERRRIKIQLWAKSINHKKDSSNHSMYNQQLIGEKYIDLKDEKWMKKKIILENKDKKTAYMYVSLEKLKE